ncbi:MAG: cardiolipin synthase, partial [Erysipelotrichaceae bacterium]
ILDVLARKVKQGVEVRLIYDDAGCIQLLPAHYDAYLRSLGLKVKVFNPIRARLAIQMNNRDHRKILVVDGKVGITGGINLSDEYINEVNLHGHWKDSSVLLKGAAVFSLTAMFIQFWNYDEAENENIWDYYLGDDVLNHYENDGYVHPDADSPTDNENVGENTHLNIINAAKKYVYIQTPYLIIDHEMRVALTLAAKSGIDVRILVPHEPDKRFVFEMTKSNYAALLADGVKIYEYTPGFVHAKTMVADDEVAIIGTINMDYRSYYLHFECGAWFYKSRCVMELKEDYLKTLEVSQELSYNEVVNIPRYLKVIRAILNLCAPLA